VLNPDGTTNWTVVFEDPQQGVLAAVAAATSMKQLRPVMGNIAQLLFKRKRDAGPRAEFLSRIERVLEQADSDGFEAARERVLGILNAEKSLRIEKAALHARNKATTQSIEKRRSSTREGPLEAFLGNPLLLGGSVALSLGLIALVVGLVLLPPDIKDEKAGEANSQTQTAEEKPAETEPTAAPRPAPKPKQQEFIALKPILADVLSDGSRRRLAMAPLIEIEKGGDISAVCALKPWIIEGVLIRMGAAAEAGTNADDALIGKVAREVQKDINSRSRGAKIKRLALVDLRKQTKDVVKASNRGCERVEIENLP
jgi:hypothetical protein